MASSSLGASRNYPRPPVFLLTGSNGAVGCGIALRLLKQLSDPSPSDIAPTPTSEFSTPQGATIVLACRNLVKAHKTRLQLLKAIGRRDGGEEWKDERKQRVLEGELSDSSVGVSGSEEAPRKPMTKREWRRQWMDKVRIEFVALDLSSVDSVLTCAEEVKSRYPYLTHLFLNAGGAPFTGLDWPYTIKRICFGFMDAVTYPDYLIEAKGVYTDDGLGWAWQTNIFGHYMLARQLLSHMLASPHPNPRIIFTGSLDGLPEAFNPKDCQGTETGMSYLSCKYQAGLIGWGLNELIAREEMALVKAKGRPFDGTVRVKSFSAHPGVVAGNMFVEVIGRILDTCMKLAFYIARIFGSPHHVIQGEKAGIAFVFLALAPITQIYSLVTATRRTTTRAPLSEETTPDDVQSLTPSAVRFGARCNRFGSEYISVDPMDIEGGRGQWWNEQQARNLISECERLREAFLKKLGTTSSAEKHV